MERTFVIVDPSEEHFLLVSQHLSMGWPNADIDEWDMESLLRGEDLEAVDAIILCDCIRDTDEDVVFLLQQSEDGNLPPMIAVDESLDKELIAYNHLELDGLTATQINSSIADVIKRHADGGFRESSSVTNAAIPTPGRADNELPVERLEGLRGYNLIRELGRGGMSRVYLATSHETGREVAIKVLDMDTIEDERMIERFIREYNMLASVENIHVAKILDQTFTDEYAFIMMERFEGGDLTRRIRKGVTPEQALDYLEQIASGLADVHRESIVHRDLKPGNILFRNDGTLAILDFGLAQMDDADENELTKHGEVYGTPSYVSPEQAKGRRVDNRSDIYSMGIIFYQMLTKKKPYRADNPMAMFYKHVHAELPKFPAQYGQYQALLDKMLAKSADDRFQTADELITALQDYK